MYIAHVSTYTDRINFLDLTYYNTITHHTYKFFIAYLLRLHKIHFVHLLKLASLVYCQTQIKLHLHCILFFCSFFSFFLSLSHYGIIYFENFLIVDLRSATSYLPYCYLPYPYILCESKIFTRIFVCFVLFKFTVTAISMQIEFNQLFA